MFKRATRVISSRTADRTFIAIGIVVSIYLWRHDHDFVWLVVALWQANCLLPSE